MLYRAGERQSTRRANKIGLEGLTVHRKAEQRVAGTTALPAERRRKGNRDLPGQRRRCWRKDCPSGSACPASVRGAVLNRLAKDGRGGRTWPWEGSGEGYMGPSVRTGVGVPGPRDAGGRARRFAGDAGGRQAAAAFTETRAAVADWRAWRWRPRRRSGGRAFPSVRRSEGGQRSADTLNMDRWIWTSNERE